MFGRFTQPFSRRGSRDPTGSRRSRRAGPNGMFPATQQGQQVHDRMPMGSPLMGPANRRNHSGHAFARHSLDLSDDEPGDRATAFMEEHVEYLSHNAAEELPNTDCPICLETIEEHICVQVKGIEGCKHVIGLSCLETFLKSNPDQRKTCPLCRAEWIPEDGIWEDDDRLNLAGLMGYLNLNGGSREQGRRRHAFGYQHRHQHRAAHTPPEFTQGLHAHHMGDDHYEGPHGYDMGIAFDDDDFAWDLPNLLDPHHPINMYRHNPIAGDLHHPARRGHISFLDPLHQPFDLDDEVPHFSPSSSPRRRRALFRRRR